jgi:hypothetical protein
MSAYPQEIWYTRCPVPTPLGIAINLGLIERDFAPLGIKVHSIQDTADPEARQPYRPSSSAQLPPGRQRAGDLGALGGRGYAGNRPQLGG